MKDYYREILPSPDAWDDAIASPLPICFWANTLRVSGDDLAGLLTAEGISYVRFSWHDAGFKTVDTVKLGNSWLYRTGLLQIQEEVSQLSGVLIDAQPHEQVIDLCAAPGNKTAQMAVSMQNTGAVMANDRSYQRIRALGQIQKRLSLMNISTTLYDATSYPRLNNTFDRVMADVPCTCEGTFRQSKRSGESAESFRPNQRASQQMTNTQIPILKKAVRMCRPGGRIVYSTCTLAPEENESVVDQVLRYFDGRLALESVAVPGFITSPGVTQWQGNSYDDTLQQAIRVWPHQNNTGGFFVAVLKKLEGRSPLQCERSEAIQDNKNNSAERTDTQAYLQLLIDRFGLPPNCFTGYHFRQTKKGVVITNPDHATPDAVSLDASGLFFMKTDMQHPKLTTSGAMLFYRQATKNIVVLADLSQRDDYLNRCDFTLNVDQTAGLEGTGYVIVVWAGHPLGLGLYFDENAQQPHRLRSLFPKA